MEGFNPRKKWNVLIVFYNMIADMVCNKKLSPILTGLFIRRKELNISTFLIRQFYFQVPKDVRLNFTHFLVLKFRTNDSFNKFNLIICQILALKTLWIFRKNALQYHLLQNHFSLIDTTLVLDNPLYFRSSILERI